MAALGLLASGCGETVIDASKAEDAVQQSLEKSLRSKVESVDCPADEKVEKGRTFDCAVTLPEGQKATATLRITSDDADVTIVGFKPISGSGADSE